MLNSMIEFNIWKKYTLYACMLVCLYAYAHDLLTLYPYTTTLVASSPRQCYIKSARDCIQLYMEQKKILVLVRARAMCKKSKPPSLETNKSSYSLRVQHLLLAQPLNPLKQIQFNIPLRGKSRRPVNG